MMKITTFVKPLFLAAAIASCQAVSAQLFELNLDQTNLLRPQHRGTPIFGDINNDGFQDLYYGGQNFEGADSRWAYKFEDGRTHDTGWWTIANLYVSNGQGRWTAYTAWPKAGVSPSDEEDQVYVYTTAQGLTPNTWHLGRFFDFNNDGNLDLYILAKNEWGMDQEDAIDGWYTQLYRNLGQEGGYAFEQIDATTLPHGNNERDGQGRNNSSFSYGDYDHDGYVDILIQNLNRWMEGDEQQSARSLTLLKNNGDGTFTPQNVFNPIPYEQNLHAADLFDVDVDDDGIPTGATPNLKAKAMSHGAAVFADLDNDGYLDIVSNGWSNDWICFYIYKNNGDGTFQELDLTESGRDVFTGVYESELAIADVNNDGWLDIISFGTQDGQDMPKVGNIYLNTGDGEFHFEATTVDGGNGLYGAAEGVARAVDLNHDGLVDIVSSGWSNVNDAGWGLRVFEQKADGTFELVQTLNGDGDGSMTYEMADFDGDGAMDVALAGYFGLEGTGNNGTNVAIFSGLSTDDIEAPAEPTNVAANAEGKAITVSFDGTDVADAYNILVRNKATGYVSTLVPADPETGKLKQHREAHVALHSAETTGLTYTVSVPADGEYEVGVQTIKNDLQTSRFVTTTVQVDVTNIAQMNSNAEVREVARYNAAGQQVRKNQHGLQLVKMSDGSVRKMMK